MLRRHRKIILLSIVLLLAARTLIPQLDVLVDCIETLREANLPWILLGIILYFAGVPVLAGQMTALSLKKLVYSLTLRVQAATMFVNKIVPSGIGTISLNIYYFIKKGHTPNQATAALTVNAITSAIAYTFLIILSLFFSDVSLGGSRKNPDIDVTVIVLGLTLLAGLVITLLHTKRLRNKIASSWVMFKHNIATYRQRPKALVASTLLNGMGSSLNMVVLLICAKAIGIDISFADALVAYTFGNIAATLVPTPGGFGSSEMGIYSGLILVGLDPASAISVTLLFRFISYWLPILPGYYFFWDLRKSLFAGYSIKSKPAR